VLREKYPGLIIIGTEPGIKPAIEQTKTGKVGVLATPATLGGEKYQKLALKLAKDKEVTLYEQACPGLVEQIEKGEANSPKTHAMLEQWLKPMRDADVDTIVLGCTHYPLVSQPIETVMQRKLHLIETGTAIAKHLLTLSKEKGHKNEGKLEVEIFMTAKLDKKIMQSILSYKKEPRTIVL
jgi:glutamate racemase